MELSLEEKEQEENNLELDILYSVFQLDTEQSLILIQ